MAKPKLTDPPREVTVQIPETLLAKIDLYLLDPVRGRLRYGARSRLINQLLREWVERKELAARSEINEEVQ